MGTGLFALLLSIETVVALLGFVMLRRFLGRRPPAPRAPKTTGAVDPAALRLRF
ncbi:MAG TPA: hypothetical protein VH369_02490 [Bryobacteraceae bacterium]|jgi:hypothetical protein